MLKVLNPVCFSLSYPVHFVWSCPGLKWVHGKNLCNQAEEKKKKKKKRHLSEQEMQQEPILMNSWCNVSVTALRLQKQLNKHVGQPFKQLCYPPFVGSASYDSGTQCS